MLSLTAATPLEKIHHVVQVIEHHQALTSKEDGIVLSIQDALKKPLESGDLRAILKKLAKDEEVITVDENPAWLCHWVVRPTPHFDNYARRIKAEYQEFQKNKPSGLYAQLKHMSPPAIPAPMPETSQPITNQTESPKRNVHVSIDFDEFNRYIILSDSFLIAQPAFDSENHRFFEYVWQNPNRVINLDELNAKLENPLKKPLAKVLENLNFRGPLKDAFFQVSKTSLCFMPSRSIEELKQSGYYPLRLFSTLKAEDWTAFLISARR